MAADTADEQELSGSEVRLVVGASSVGTIFEWYDFFIYGTLSGLIGAAFFPGENAILQTLLVWAGFAIGFGFRPLGAILFGFLGDRLGRKYTFLVTVTLMGVATAGVGLVPSAETIGLFAPAIVIVLRILQGLALGGEYGGAAIYVAEHAAPNRRGFYTSFIQASVVGGFVLSIVVVLACRALIPEAAFADWGWRIPFLLSLLLLAVSLWMRLRLSESPVFKAMKEAGETSGNPFVESFTYPGNIKRIIVALGVTAGLTTIWYTAFFTTLSFLKGPMRMEDLAVELILLIAAVLSMGFYIFFGRLSDRIGRKIPIVWGNAAILVLLFPVMWGIGALANPQLAQTSRAAPVSVSGPECSYNPFADLTGAEQSQCGQLLEVLTGYGIHYQIAESDALSMQVADRSVSFEDVDWENGTERRDAIRTELEAEGYSFAKQTPPLVNMIGIVALIVVLGILSAANYGPVAALLSEMFPAKIRYSSMSIPYHIGAGYFGGFLPLIAAYIVARTGNSYAGLWYTWGFVAMGVVICAWGLKSGPPRDFEDSDPVT
ncbi:MFS transporter [Croceicoccus gelatinilyticus]|uniref:MFS transporter n=1 Tax=Croceicoccus gelatinilyticus TaxID=2835536 RepID=UPI001BCFB7CD|nr:MFS transporter [Croceicoccus gelatinilyticus]MBS7668775.1 MFS transporter [Croceicoccus gelatinilyticus]